MPRLERLFKNNREWAEQINAEDPEFFAKLSTQQSPEYLWIGCSDSRVPANQIVGLLPGEVFVHRNVANVVVHTDLNAQSVLQYAVDVLKVKYIMVVGHYGCGGVAAALKDQQFGLIDNWLRNIRDIHYHFRDQFQGLEEQQQVDLLCELNVKAQVRNIAHTPIVQNAWKRGQELSVHGWIYGISNGLIKNLEVSISQPEQIPSVYRLR